MSEIEPLREPFKGLEAFMEADAPIFFGRDQERALISANLRTRRLTILFGPSGVGKSSLIHAGVVHHLRSIRSRSHRILIVFSNWSVKPLEELKASILSAFREKFPEVYNAEQVEDLQSKDLAELIKRLTATTESELLIILDQFEEYFVYHGHQKELNAFDKEFARAVVDARVTANFLISIREDWLARLDRFQQDIPNVFENSIRIEHLSRAQAETAITRSIDKYNEGFPATDHHRRIRVGDGFVERALDQLEALERESGLETDEGVEKPTQPPQYIQASRLQIVMKSLWKRIKDYSPPTFNRSLLARDDEAKRIFKSNLRASLSHLSRRQKKVAARFVGYLISDSGTKFASSAEGLATRSQQPADKIRPVLRRLSARDVRLLNEIPPSPMRPDRPRYELTSDVLADPILEWSRDMAARQRLRTWLSWFTVVVVLIGSVAALALTIRRSQERLRLAEIRQTEIEQDKNRFERALDVVRTQSNKVPHSKAVLRKHGMGVSTAVFTEDGHVLTASKDGSAVLWDIETQKPVHEYIRDEKGLTCASMSPQGDALVTASTDGSVRLWDLKAVRFRELRKSDGKHMTDITFSPRGDFIVGANTVGTIFVWNAATGIRVKVLEVSDSPARQISFSPNGRYFAVASEDHSVYIWKPGEWEYFRRLTGHEEKVNGLAFSPDEELIATVSADTTVRVWNLTTGQSRVHTGHTASVNSVDFDKQGIRLLTTSDDTTARIWNLPGGKSITLSGHTDKVLTASFSPNGEYAVTGSKDKSVRVWSADTGLVLSELLGHSEQINYVTYSDDGRFVLTASDDASARVWFTSDGGELRLEQPVIEAKPPNYVGPCPVTISFPVSLRASSGRGTVIYRYADSDNRIWDYHTITFDNPGLKYVNWYWRIVNDYSGWESIEIIEPKGFKPVKVKFTVDCTNDNQSPAQPAESPTVTPSPIEEFPRRNP